MSSPAPRPSLNRRKVRKGTFSCWECKNRKTRCEFKPTCSVCVSCQRRGLACTSQEFEAESRSNDHRVENRVSHVEGLVSQLVQQRYGSKANSIFVPMQDYSIIPNPPWQTRTSMSSYLHSIFPSPSIATTIVGQGDFLPLPSFNMGAGKEQLVQALEKPSHSAHPIQFARKLMQLALCLQQLDDPAYDAAQYVDILARHVLAQDVLLESLDGLETLVMMTVYYVSSGIPRAGWLTIRRALAIAQLMGIDMDPSERARILWILLLSGDRFMSLALGLPLAVASNDFECVSIDVNPQTGLAHIHLVASGRIIARNLRMQRHHEPRYEETQDIDCYLKEATRSLPISWWTFRMLDRLAEEELVGMTAKLQIQIHHHYFILLVHQPYLIRALRSPVVDEDGSYSRMAIPPACREVLLRFLVLRSFHRGISYRGIDDKAFTAVIALLLAHIDGHQLCQMNVLEHQRPHDLGIIGDVLRLIEEISIQSEMVQKVHKLIEIEFEAANGVIYTWAEEGDPGTEVQIPYFGIMRPVLSTPQEKVPKQDGFLPMNSNSLVDMDFGLGSMVENMMPIEQEASTNIWDFGDLVEARRDEFDYPLENFHPNDTHPQNLR